MNTLEEAARLALYALENIAVDGANEAINAYIATMGSYRPARLQSLRDELATIRAAIDALRSALPITTKEA